MGDTAIPCCLTWVAKLPLYTGWLLALAYLSNNSHASLVEGFAGHCQSGQMGQNPKSSWIAPIFDYPQLNTLLPDRFPEKNQLNNQAPTQCRIPKR